MEALVWWLGHKAHDPEFVGSNPSTGFYTKNYHNTAMMMLQELNCV